MRRAQKVTSNDVFWSEIEGLFSWIVGCCIYREIGDDPNVEDISVSSLRTIVLYGTDSDIAENSVQHDLLWAYGTCAFKIDISDFLK